MYQIKNPFKHLSSFMLFIIAVLMCCTAFIAGLLYIAQALFEVQDANADPWYFNIKNDFPVKNGRDRFLTNAFEFKYGEWKFYNVMFTPTDKKNPNYPAGDRPWDGESYLEYEYRLPVAFAETYVAKLRAGAVGKASGSQALQTFIHDDLGLGQHPTYAGQNPSEPLVELVLSKQYKDYLQSSLGDSALIGEYGVEGGTAKISAFLDQEYRKHFFKYFYPYVGIKGEAIYYDTHLDGRIFHEDYYQVIKNPFVATFRGGFELYFPESEWFIDFHYEQMTNSFKGQDAYHSYGSLSFGKKY